MTAIQQIEKNSFSIARLYGTDASGQKYLYAEAKDVGIALKTDLKEYWSEGTFAAGAATGHTSVDLSLEQYRLRLSLLALQMGLAAPVASTYAPIQDETGTIDPTAHTYSLVQASTYIVGSEVVYVVHTASNGRAYKVPYVRTTGSPAAGVSYSIASGVLTFASGDASLPVVVDYNYANVNGQTLVLKNVPQNSGQSFQMECVKYDVSPIDGSNGFFVATLNAVKFAGLDMPSKEGEWNTYKSTGKAYQDPSGNVAEFTFVNE